MSATEGPVVGGIEAGGTKFVCAIGRGPGEVFALERFPTTTPEDTLARAVAFFEHHRHAHNLSAVGIGTFGPADVDPESPTFGYVTSTPKPGWRDTYVAGAVHERLGVPIAFDTDVNAAAVGEHAWGAARGLDTFVYLTVGTGIGGGGMIGGRLMHGLVHPEMGHIFVPHDHVRDPFDGVCPYHGDCLEGLASGPSIAQRWGTPGEELPDDHPAWELEAHYLGLGLANLICTLSPQRIVLGGGVGEKPGLLPKVRASVLDVLNGYVRHPVLERDVESFIVAPGLGNRAGVLGAMELARRMLADAATSPSEDATATFSAS